MKHIICSIIILTGLSGFVFSQTTENIKTEKEITICPIKLNVAVANFRFAYRYLIKTNGKGSVTKVEQFGKDDFPKFIKDEDFIHCMKSWKLNPSEEYYVVFVLGTNTYLGKNYISINSIKEKIIINLGTIGPELIIDDIKAVRI